MMSAAAEDEIVQAPPQPPSPLPDEPFSAPLTVHGIDDDEFEETRPQSKHSFSDIFSTLPARVSDAVRASRRTMASFTSRVTLPSIMFFGDSITEYGTIVTDEHGPGWVARLQDSYAGRVDCFARGYSGYNTQWALHVFPQLVHGLPGLADLKAITILFGSNDAVIDGEQQHVNLIDYKRNLTTLVSFVRNLRGRDPVVPVLITPPAVQQTKDGPNPIRLTERTSKYADACKEVGDEMRCPVVDFHSAMVEKIMEDDGFEGDVEKGLDKFLHDGLHLNANGNELLAEIVLGTLGGITGLNPDVLQRPFPEWRDVDPADPASTLGLSSLV